MRALVVATLAAVVAASCGADGEHERTPVAKQSSLRFLWKQPGLDVGLIMGTSDYAPGAVRVSFLVVTPRGRPISRERARVWVARGLDEAPFARAEARLERVGIPGGYTDDLGVTDLYVTHLLLSRPGKYWILAQPIGGTRIQGLGNVIVKERSTTPEVGARALPSRTPTLANVGGDASKLTTRVPPDTELLRHSVADSLEVGAPFVLVFATPKYCTSRTCGPVVDVVDAVRTRYERRGVRFIHVEIFKRNNPSLGTNRFFREWHLPSEPWTFLIGRDGRIKAKFEGSFSVRELERAVERHLI